MEKAIKLIEYDIVESTEQWITIRRSDGKTARCLSHWLMVANGKAYAVSQTKQVRIGGLDWEG